MKNDLKNKSIKELEDLVVSLGEKRFVAKNIFNWIHAKNVLDINEITNISKVFREKLLKQEYFISQLKVYKKLDDPDGTTKYVFEMADQKVIETVLLNDGDRTTLCISSQVGCKMNCQFCATAQLKLQRNLTAAEIVDQIYYIEKDVDKKINNVVYMGMGEPLDNYDEVIKSVKILNDPNGKNIGARNITISTVGIIPGIQKLMEEKIQVRLAISLHANTDNLRNQIVPINKKYPVEELIKAVKEYQFKTNRRVTFEYVLLDGVNNTRQHARGLMKLIGGIKCLINLIEFNESPGTRFKAPKKESIKEFKWLLSDRGFEVVIRYKRGREIQAACGQLGSK